MMSLFLLYSSFTYCVTLFEIILLFLLLLNLFKGFFRKKMIKNIPSTHKVRRKSFNNWSTKKTNTKIMFQYMVKEFLCGWQFISQTVWESLKNFFYNLLRYKRILHCFGGTLSFLFLLSSWIPKYQVHIKYPLF